MKKMIATLVLCGTAFAVAATIHAPRPLTARSTAQAICCDPPPECPPICGR